MPTDDLAPADVLLVTVTSLETRAVFDALKAQTGRAPAPHYLDDKTYYDLGEVGGARVWLARCEQGAAVPSGALVTVISAIHTLRPAAVVLVGVGFGARSGRQQIGDVLVATQLQLYEPQRLGGDPAGAPRIVPTGDRASVSPRLLDRFRHGELVWPEGHASVEFGLLLTGEKLVEHPAALVELLAREPLALGGELEGAGLYVAAFHRRVDWIVVRGIGGWPGVASANPRADQALAARNAAAFTAHTLAQGGFAPRQARPAARPVQPPAEHTLAAPPPSPEDALPPTEQIPAPPPSPEDALPDEVRLALAQIHDPAQPLAVRLEAGATLGRLGDPRLLDPSTGDAPIGGYWCLIKPGPFWFGDDRERKLEQITLPHTYKIARFPVTNAEYRRFVEAGGYTEQQWWSAEGWAWRLPGGHPICWEQNSQPIIRPWSWDKEAYNQPSQPVVDVSWYEAAAYCGWLTAQGHGHGWLPNDVMLRLPTWLEWQRTARHTDRRRYPWGDAELTPKRANYQDTKIGKPAPVGSFPAGQAICGALDLAGNVWEWMATIWGQPDQRVSVADAQPSEKLMLAGGSFLGGNEYLCCGARYRNAPFNWNVSVGFRVIWSPRSLK